MIPFNETRMCPVCERQILIGAYLLLPDQEEAKHYCFACAVQLTREWNDEHGIKTQKILIVKPEPKEEPEQ